MNLKETLTSELIKTIKRYQKTETIFMADDLLALAKAAEIINSLDIELNEENKLNKLIEWLKDTEE